MIKPTEIFINHHIESSFIIVRHTWNSYSILIYNDKQLCMFIVYYIYIIYMLILSSNYVKSYCASTFYLCEEKKTFRHLHISWIWLNWSNRNWVGRQFLKNNIVFRSWSTEKAVNITADLDIFTIVCFFLLIWAFAGINDVPKGICKTCKWS